VAEDVSGAPGDVVQTSPTAAVELPDALISHSDPLEPERPDVAELERYLESTGPTSGSAATSADSSSSAVEIAPPERPPWVNVPAFSIDQVDYIPVTSGPCATRGECRRMLADAMSQAVAEYVDDHRGANGSVTHIRFEAAYVRTQLRHGGVYEETVQASFGPMIQQHALLKLDKSFREEIDLRWNQVKVTSRLAQVTLVALGALLGLAVVFTYLRLDTFTKGYYSRRLQVAAGAVILGLVAMGVLLARWIPWL
jgi:hypothetical protein